MTKVNSLRLSVITIDSSSILLTAPLDGEKGLPSPQISPFWGDWMRKGTNQSRNFISVLFSPFFAKILHPNYYSIQISNLDLHPNWIGTTTLSFRFFFYFPHEMYPFKGALSSAATRLIGKFCSAQVFFGGFSCCICFVLCHLLKA